MSRLVKEFLTAQTLTILPQNSFGDAVTQFVDKDDKHAMETFVNESLVSQLKHLMDANDVDDAMIMDEMDQYRSQLENLFASGQLKKTRKAKIKPKPDGWESEFDGPWADQPAALIRSDDEGEKDDDESLASVPAKPAARGRGKAAATSRQTIAATKKATPVAKGGRGKRKIVEEEEDDEDDDGDIVMISDDDDESAEDLFVKPAKKAPARKAAAKAPARAKSPAKKTASTRAKAPAASKQSTLNFSQTPSQRSQPTRATPARGRKAVEPVSGQYLLSMTVFTDDFHRATMRYLMMTRLHLTHRPLEAPAGGRELRHII
ncbi:meiotic recombination [Neocucurbitaria cava]|uniref:Meiotic recombination n=1 Tax=Neocucurbitaria cava TaxID=798079 RepID=A0A9W9CKV7_9PLEO|nr:meiotic recombination [Neocucurbitaria cava]